MEWTVTRCRSSASSLMETLEVRYPLRYFLEQSLHVMGKHIFFLFDTADSGKRKKRGNELEQIDCTPPEHILPGSKDRPLVPLQPQNKDWKVKDNIFN